MSKFSDYVPLRPRDATPAIGLRIDEAQQSDLDAIVDLTIARGGQPEQHMESLQAQVAASPQACQLFVARLDNEMVAFARVSMLRIRTIPTGWYLTGLIVAPVHRLRGIGRALTEHRIRWLCSRTDSVYYFTNVQNQASVDLHTALGFREIQRSIRVPNCSFEGGTGVLYCLTSLRLPACSMQFNAIRAESSALPSGTR